MDEEKDAREGEANRDAIRRYKVASLLLRGTTSPSAIAAQLGIDETAVVRKDLRFIKSRWLKASVDSLEASRAREEARLQLMLKEYMDAWERSKLPDTRRTRQGGEYEVKRDGNPAFLAGAIRCHERICDLYGLDAPKRAEVTGKNGAALHVRHTHAVSLEDFKALSIEERIRMLREPLLLPKMDEEPLG